MKKGALVLVFRVPGGDFLQEGQLPAGLLPAPARGVNRRQVQPGPGETRLQGQGAPERRRGAGYVPAGGESRPFFGGYESVLRGLQGGGAGQRQPAQATRGKSRFPAEGGP